MNARLQLDYTPAGVAQLCRHLASSAASDEHLLAMLSALQTFIASGASPASQAQPVYHTIRQQLIDAQEQIRARLLQGSAKRLLEALLDFDVVAIAALYRPLSRSGFWQLLELLDADLPADARRHLRQRLDSWLTDARRRGEQASGYPDAVDLVAAGIDVASYQALQDIRHFLGEAAV